jgi:hypothetical protein
MFVPKRSLVEIHPGNWAGDTQKGCYSDLLGCIALGHGYGMLQPPEKSYPMQNAIFNSRVAIADFMKRCAGQNLIDVEIKAFDLAGQ